MLTVTIAGKSGTGKSTLAIELQRFLTQQGFHGVTIVEQLDDHPHPNEQPQRLQSILTKDPQITIATRQLPRDFQLQDDVADLRRELAQPR